MNTQKSFSNFPDFLCAGTVKAGTTWLYKTLLGHPEIYLPTVKPVYYWDRNIDKDISNYLFLFRNSNNKTIGEFSASYSVLPIENIKKIYKYNSNIKIILVFREPRSRAWSEARMELSLINPLKDNAKASDYLNFLKSEKCLKRGDYLNIIDNWSSIIPEKNLGFFYYDELKDDPKGFLDKVCNFLKISRMTNLNEKSLKKKIFEGTKVELTNECSEYLTLKYNQKWYSEFNRKVKNTMPKSWMDNKNDQFL